MKWHSPIMIVAQRKSPGKLLIMKYSSQPCLDHCQLLTWLATVIISRNVTLDLDAPTKPSANGFHTQTKASPLQCTRNGVYRESLCNRRPEFCRWSLRLSTVSSLNRNFSLLLSPKTSSCFQWIRNKSTHNFVFLTLVARSHLVVVVIQFIF